MSRNREDRVRAAFAEQEVWCERLGSPFTARLCGLMARRLGRNTPVGAALLDWPGDPSPGADSLPLRLCGGLHDLVRRGEASELASLYPPGPDPDEDLLWKALERVLGAKSAGLSQWMQVAPQTNEVGRSAVLMSGLLVAASEFAMPIRLYELGASAGLNLKLVMHSVAFQYFAAETRARVVRRLDRVGQFASAEAPLAWLRFEKAPLDEHFSLRLRTWPGEDRLLAWAHPHGRWVRWLPD